MTTADPNPDTPTGHHRRSRLRLGALIMIVTAALLLSAWFGFQRLPSRR